MDRILNGILKYRETLRERMVEQFKLVEHKIPTKAVLITCMDSRMLPSKLLQIDVGDMFIVRNAGNLIPHSQYFPDEVTTNEPAALELGCVIHNIKHIIVCGHSNCKAMRLLYRLHYDHEFASQENRRISPLRAWVFAHALNSLNKFQQFELSGFVTPLLFQAETPMKKFVAHIDQDKKLCYEDKLSQINTLQQMENIASYRFLKKRFEKSDLHIHALWFDVYTGEVYYFSRIEKKFVEVDGDNINNLLDEVNKNYS